MCKQLTPAWAVCSCQGPQLWCTAVQTLCLWLHAAWSIVVSFHEGPVAESWGVALQISCEDKTQSPVLQRFLGMMQDDGISVKLATTVTKILISCWAPASQRLSSGDLHVLLINAVARAQEEGQA